MKSIRLAQLVRRSMQVHLVIGLRGLLALCGTVLAKNQAGEPLGDAVFGVFRRQQAPCRRGDARGSEFSLTRTFGPRSGLFQDQPLRRQIRHRPEKPRILGFQLIQLLHLIALQAAVLRPPPVVCDLRHAY
jgi:hypothetical protein